MQSPYHELIQTLAQVISVVVATVAIFYAVEANKKSQLTFEHQLNQSEKLAAASMAPFLFTHMVRIINSDGDTCSIDISIENTGEGTALINSYFAVSDFGDKVRSIPDAIDGSSGDHVSQYEFIGSGQYVPANGQILLARISAKEIAASDKYGIKEALIIVEEFRQKLSDILLELEYSNVLNTETRSMSSSFSRDRGRIIRTLNGSCEVPENV